MKSADQKPLAIVSCTDKTGLDRWVPQLIKFGFEILSTGGTGSYLKELGIPITEVSSYTGQPEFLGGRVKTLHPKIHGGILFDRNLPQHSAEMEADHIRPIDLVIVNLYDFSGNSPGKKAQEAIEYIDIGGPTMLRAAAKNYVHCLPLIDPADYEKVVTKIVSGKNLPMKDRLQLACKVFKTISEYDQKIAQELQATEEVCEEEAFPSTLPPFALKRTLRYGENPHQKAALYTGAGQGIFSHMTQHQGKELSYNNILDLDAAIGLAADLSDPGVVIVKHTNPCGVASRKETSIDQLFHDALNADPQSAFGGIVCCNRPVEKEAAIALTSLFIECVTAPSFSEDALAILSKKSKLRVITADLSVLKNAKDLAIRSVSGGLLVQETDDKVLDASEMKAVGEVPLSLSKQEDLSFGMVVCKHLKSNGIVIARDGVTLGIGAGQMSRIDAIKFAAEKARQTKQNLKGAVLASDGFFPFRDSVEFSASLGIDAIIQPGGSVRDQESIDAANENKVMLAFSGVRHFRH